MYYRNAGNILCKINIYHKWQKHSTFKPDLVTDINYWHHTCTQLKSMTDNTCTHTHET